MHSCTRLGSGVMHAGGVGVPTVAKRVVLCLPLRTLVARLDLRLAVCSSGHPALVAYRKCKPISNSTVDGLQFKLTGTLVVVIQPQNPGFVFDWLVDRLSACLPAYQSV